VEEQKIAKLSHFFHRKSKERETGEDIPIFSGELFLAETRGTMKKTNFNEEGKYISKNCPKPYDSVFGSM
jgi:hypothetical protein